VIPRFSISKVYFIDKLDDLWFNSTMTTRIETLDGGDIDTGFWGPDVSKIQLGDLPTMTTQQFVGYAALSLVQDIIPKLNDDERIQWARNVSYVRQQVEHAPVKNVTDKFFALSADELAEQFSTVSEKDRGELLDELAAAVVPIEKAIYYPESPFTVQGDGQRISLSHEGETHHVIDTKDFFYLFTKIVHGGFVGWDERGTYQEVKDATVLVDSALSAEKNPDNEFSNSGVPL
jgi:hypothetical protein